MKRKIFIGIMMVISTIFLTGCATQTYMITDPNTGKTVVVQKNNDLQNAIIQGVAQGATEAIIRHIFDYRYDDYGNRYYYSPYRNRSYRHMNQREAQRVRSMVDQYYYIVNSKK